MDHDIEIGAIIEFDDGSGHQLGVVVDLIGKKKLAVLTAEGDRMRTIPDDISAFLGRDSVDNLEEAQEKLAALDATIDGRCGDVDLEMLWEFLRIEDEPKSAESMAELMFADDEAATVVAIRRALRRDPTYFKHRRDDSFEPRSDGQVAELKRQREAEQQQREQKQRILRTIAETLELPSGQRATSIEGAMGEDDALRDAIYLLQDFAANGRDYARGDEATELLDEIVDTVEVRLEGHPDQKAYFLMRHLELWEEHENLALHRYRISPEMPDEIVDRARRVADGAWEPENFRRDLSDWTALTIDAPSSRDLDDALSCRPTADGGFEVAIHIADPSAFVEIDSPLDREARSRGTSIYLPDGNIPMFPRPLSEGKMSLHAGMDRPAMTTRVVFDETLDVDEVEIFASIIRVDRRLSYDEADAILRSQVGDEHSELLRNLEFIADECRRRRCENGATSFQLPDTRVCVDTDRDPPGVSMGAVDTDTPARNLVSELMILNNDQIGRFCARHEIPAIYRIQEPPEQPLVDEELLAIPEGPARSFAQIRRLNPGAITTHPGLHFGLGLHSYAQASSPIRRYADLVCQRQIKAFVADRKLPYGDEEILEVLGAVERAASKARDAEYETLRYWLLYALSRRGDEPMEAVVVDRYDDRGDRVSVFLLDCAYRSKCSLRSPVPLGERVSVVVERANPRFDVLRLRQAPSDY